ncbi:MAG: nucleotidyltransferase domain-containing protein [Candidatus Bathyarchaeia archaeon]
MLKPPIAVLRPEVKVIAALLGGRPKRFSELRNETGLSEPWLSKTLRKLVRGGLVVLEGRRYALGHEGLESGGIIEKPTVYSHFLIEKAVRVAEELARRPRVLAVALFGTVARLEADPESDVDLLIIVDTEDQGIGRAIIDLEVKYDLPIEATVVSLEELKLGLAAEPNMIFGVLVGYLVVVDKRGEVTELLSEKSREITSTYALDRKAMLWLKR